MNDSPAPPQAPVAPLAFQMIGAVHGLEAQLEARLAEAGLSLAKFGVLAKLQEAGEPLALGSLADRCCCVRSNMTQLIDRLEADKLVERVADPSDRRSVRAALTPEGQARCRQGATILNQAEREALAPLSETDREALIALLGRLAG